MKDQQAPAQAHPMQAKQAFLVVAGLCCLAVAQPLFDLFTRNAEFLVIHHAGPAAILLFSAILILVLPAVLTLAVVAAGPLNGKARMVILGLLVAILAGLLALPPLKAMNWLPGRIVVGLAIVFGGMAGFFWYRIPHVRTFTAVLSFVALLAVPSVFFLNPRVSRMLLSSGEPRVPALHPASSPPIVLIIWDEFPDTSLMDATRNVDEILYPSFARLARASTWYRNATTVCDETPPAVSAILTGKIPGERSLPSFIDYPANLFSFLRGSYELHVMETQTQLYEAPSPDPLQKTVWQLLSDSLAVYLNLVLPHDVAGGLPDVTLTWQGFWNQDLRRRENDDRALVFGGFLDSIHSGSRPRLYFLHLLLPHQPFEYLPSGERYPSAQFQHPDPDLAKKTGAVEAHAEHCIRHYQRYLLQLQFVDSMMGKLLDRLEATGLYDRAMVIVTADHGITFTPGVSGRSVSRVNYPDVISVPLFVKYPGQRAGEISDRSVRTIDILPTILDVLGAPVQGLDGVSLRSQIADRGKLRVLQSAFSDHREWFDFDPDTSLKYRSLDWKISLFGQRNDNHLFRIGPHQEWLGKSVGDFQIEGKADGVVLQLRAPEGGYNLVPGSGVVPCLIYGKVAAEGGLKNLTLGIAVNGRFAAFTRPAPVWKGETRSVTRQFGVLIQEETFHPGPNNVELFVVSPSGKLLLPEVRQ